jgi:hypothetical protein
LDAEGRRSGLASSVVAIRLRVAGEFASQIRRNRDVVPLDASIRLCPTQIQKLKTRRASLPSHLPLAKARKGQDTVKLSTERKHLTNILKMVAFQIESDLVEMIRPHCKRAEDEGRTLVQTILQDAADIEPAEGELRITLAPLSSPHRSRVVESLCTALNKTNTMFPGAQLQMRFAVAQPRS